MQATLIQISTLSSLRGVLGYAIMGITRIEAAMHTGTSILLIQAIYLRRFCVRERTG